jgi:hypothetical protein
MRIFTLNRRKFSKLAISAFVLFLAFILILSQGTTIHHPESVKAEKSAKNSEDGKKSDESVVLISASTGFSGYHVHFDHFYKFVLNIPELISSHRQVFCYFTGFFNNYFNALFHFIISTKAP